MIAVSRALARQLKPRTFFGPTNQAKQPLNFYTECLQLKLGSSTTHLWYHAMPYPEFGCTGLMIAVSRAVARQLKPRTSFGPTNQAKQPLNFYTECLQLKFGSSTAHLWYHAMPYSLFGCTGWMVAVSRAVARQLKPRTSFGPTNQAKQPLNFYTECLQLKFGSSTAHLWYRAMPYPEFGCKRLMIAVSRAVARQL